MIDGVPNEWAELDRLEASVQTQMERVAMLRGYAGQLRAAILDARDNTQPGSTAHFILDHAANIPAPENG